VADFAGDNDAQEPDCQSERKRKKGLEVAEVDGSDDARAATNVGCMMDLHEHHCGVLCACERKTSQLEALGRNPTG